MNLKRKSIHKMDRGLNNLSASSINQIVIALSEHTILSFSDVSCYSTKNSLDISFGKYGFFPKNEEQLEIAFENCHPSILIEMEGKDAAIVSKIISFYRLKAYFTLNSKLNFEPIPFIDNLSSKELSELIQFIQLKNDMTPGDEVLKNICLFLITYQIKFALESDFRCASIFPIAKQTSTYISSLSEKEKYNLINALLNEGDTSLNSLCCAFLISNGDLLSLGTESSSDAIRREEEHKSHFMLHCLNGARQEPDLQEFVDTVLYLLRTHTSYESIKHKLDLLHLEPASQYIPCKDYFDSRDFSPKKFPSLAGCVATFFRPISNSSLLLEKNLEISQLDYSI